MASQNFYVNLNGNNNQLNNWTKLTGLTTGLIVNPTDAVNKDYVDTLLTGLGNFRGNHDASTGLFPTSVGTKKGDYWIVSIAGSITGLTPISQVRPGDVIYAKIDAPAGASDWFVVEGNKDLASTTVAGINALAESADVATEIAALANTQDTITPALLATYLTNIGVSDLTTKGGDGITWNGVGVRFDLDLATNSGLELTASDGTGELRIKGLADFTANNVTDLENVGYDTSGNVFVSKSEILGDAFNGLTYDTIEAAIKLGGVLTDNTLINVDTWDLNIQGAGGTLESTFSNTIRFRSQGALDDVDQEINSVGISSKVTNSSNESMHFLLDASNYSTRFIDMRPVIGKKGIQYMGFGETNLTTAGPVDYSTLDFNSLVPKKYIDDVTSTLVTGQDGQGISFSGGTFNIGGGLDVTGNRTVNLALGSASLNFSQPTAGGGTSQIYLSGGSAGILGTGTGTYNTRFYVDSNGLGQLQSIIGGVGSTVTIDGNLDNSFNISSSRPGFQGFTYAADYSANFVDRTLVDKEYVDGAITAGTTAVNGLNKVGTDIKLGGVLTENTNVYGAFLLNLGTQANPLQALETTTTDATVFTASNPGVAASDLQLDSTFFNLRHFNAIAAGSASISFEDGNNSGILITDAIDNVGLRGAVLFPATDNLDFVQKKYVDDAVSGGTADNGLTKTGSNIQLGGPLIASTTITTAPALPLIISHSIGGTTTSFGQDVSISTTNTYFEASSGGLSFYGNAGDTGYTYLGGNVISYDYRVGVAKRGIQYEGFGETDLFTPGLVDYSTLSFNSLVPKKYVDDVVTAVSFKQTVNLVASTPLTITHNLNEATPQVTCWYNNELVNFSIVSTGVNTLTVESGASLTGVIVKISK